MSVRVSGDIVLDYHDSLIYERDIQLLEGPYWLNDTLIAFYMDYLEFEEFNNLDVCFVRPALAQCVKITTDSNLNIYLGSARFKFKPYAVIILNDWDKPDLPGGTHWSLLIFSRNELKFYHLDSSEGFNNKAARDLAMKLSNYVIKDYKCDFQILRSLQQKNSYDCGLFVLCNLENVLHHIFKKRKLTKLGLISESQVSRKRLELKRLIINLYKRNATQPKSSQESNTSSDSSNFQRDGQ